MSPRLLLICSLLFIPTAALMLAQEAKQVAAPQNAPGPDKVKEGNRVVVKVVGESITEQDILAAIDEFVKHQQLPPQQIQQKNSLFFNQALESLIGFALIKNESKERKITADSTKVEAAYKAVVARFPSADAYQKALAAQGVTDAQIRKNLEESQVYQQVIEIATKDVPAPTDAEIAKFYDSNPQYFAVPEQVHAAHILLKVDKNATPEKKAEAKKKLEALRADIENKTVQFSEAAAKVSEDPGSAKNGGDLGFFARGRMVKPFEDAAFSTKPGMLTPVIETQFGYHLIKVLELKPAGKAPLDQAKSSIRSYLQQQAKQDAVQKHIAELKKKTAIERLMTQEEWNKRHPVKQN